MDITTSSFSNIKEIEESKELYIPRKKTNKELIGEIIRHIILFCISIVTFFPFIWMMTSSLKTKDEIFQFPPK